jgi:hypothetical protein
MISAGGDLIKLPLGYATDFHPEMEIGRRTAIHVFSPGCGQVRQVKWRMDMIGQAIVPDTFTSGRADHCPYFHAGFIA